MLHKNMSVNRVDANIYGRYQRCMEKTHSHAAALDRIGATAIKSHFNLSRQGLWKWRKFGVPRIHHEPLRMLAMVRGVQVPELAKEQ